ncbi:Creatininase [Candidatus Omnitrophus magneticus]|uniref:Creatininase n=1 Tax=Candidatus Omnitrophus magneticus TaxID=1609969 RepID=A0A0F0CTJ0_9BACT|nr:Creatininase [Candidatus Omnitrophus magneticus]
MLIEEITMEDYKNHLKKTKTIIIPFGVVEEHGSHLPLNTDTIIVCEILKAVAQKRAVFVAPPVNYGVCTTTGKHIGTLSISSSALRAITRDLIKDAYNKGLRNFFLISGHGGSLHMSALKEVAEQLIDDLDDLKIAAFSPYDILWKELSAICETPGDSHGGELETSLILALAPHLVKGRATEEYPKLPRPFIVRDKVKYWPGGVWGNPEKATREKGLQAIEIIVSKVVELIDELKTGY